MKRASNLSGAIGVVTIPMPVRPKGSTWTLKPVKVAYYPGETEADAFRFASAITQSYMARFGVQEGAVVAHAVRPVSRPTSVRRAVRPVSRSQRPAQGRSTRNASAATCCGRTFRKRGAGLAWHVEHVHAGVAA